MKKDRNSNMYKENIERAIFNSNQKNFKFQISNYVSYSYKRIIYPF